MAGARSAGRMPFMSASPLNRRSAALYGAELTQPGYQQRIAESLKNLGVSIHPDTVGRFFKRAQSGKLPLGFEPEPRQAASPAEPLSTLPPIGPDATDPLLAEIAPNSPWAPRKPIGRKDREWLIG